MPNRLTQLTNLLQQHGVDGFILPSGDEYMGEYVPASARRLEWLTGFTGSAGLAILLNKGTGVLATTSQGEVSRSGTRGSVSPYDSLAAFFTDGRYTLQAANEVKDFELHNSGTLSPEEWLKANAPKDAVIGYDPFLHSLNTLKRFERAAAQASFKAVTPNPIDAIWDRRPAAPDGPALIQPVAHAGETVASKRARIAKAIADNGADAAFLTLSDSVCWLLNMRGRDVPYTPFILAYASIARNGSVTLYIDETRVPDALRAEWGDEVTLRAPSLLASDFGAYAASRVMYDPASSPVWFYQMLKEVGATVIEAPDPCQLPKACKNAVELEGMRAAHMRDGLAVTKFLCWLDGAQQRGERLTEMTISDALEHFRKQSEWFLEPSFPTICGSGPNGAVVHYRATEANHRELDRDTLLLVDSGGQYIDGTTDITRTVAVGTPTAEMKDRFTRVLKGHIALARAQFPEGTSGSQLDALARQYLWGVGLDYDHGTGHGVGSHLSVHEGPQRISKRGGDASLKAGMVLSNEPGYYQAGEFGIRIENLVAVTEVRHGEKAFLGFETITLVPIDLRLVDRAMLDMAERKWLDDYHARIATLHSPGLSAAEKSWLNDFIII